MSKIFLVFSLILLSACGESPILNHKMEPKGIKGSQIFSQSVVLEFQKSDMEFSIDWTMGPHMGESKFILRTWKKDLGTLSGPFQDPELTLNVVVWMTSMGHGSAPVKITKLNVGEYEVSNVQFFMGGAWDLKFQLKQGSQVVDETIVSYSI